MKVVSWEKKKRAGFPSAGSAGNEATQPAEPLLKPGQRLWTGAGDGPRRRRRGGPATRRSVQHIWHQDKRTRRALPQRSRTAADCKSGTRRRFREAHAAPGCTRTAGNRVPVPLKEQPAEVWDGRANKRRSRTVRAPWQRRRAGSECGPNGRATMAASR